MRNMSITNVTENDLAIILTNGMLDDVKKTLKTNLMNNAEKEIDLAIDTMVSKMTGFVSTMRDFSNDRLLISVNINGVPKK
jgi:hypothetical protein